MLVIIIIDEAASQRVALAGPPVYVLRKGLIRIFSFNTFFDLVTVGVFKIAAQAAFR